MATASEVFDFDSECKKAINFALESIPNVSELKQVQEEAVISFIKRRDVMAVLPTGYGKSLIFQLIPGICSYLHGKGFDYPSKPILVVVCPLKALIASHLKEVECCGISACDLSEVKDTNEVLEGQYSLVFASPETILENSTWRTMLQSTIYQQNMFGIVTDEAHVVPKWYVRIRM